MTLGKRICTIGGGSGMPIVNRALIRAGFENIDSIVTPFDSGGDSGRIRTDERGNILAFSDYWRSMISLWKNGKQKEIWEEMLKFRDGRDRNFGNIFFQFMAEKVGNLSRVDTLFSQLTGAKICGRVIPVSLEPSNVCFKTRSGRSYEGEHRLDELRMSDDQVKDVWLKPKVAINCEVIEALGKAEVIIVCPGSMYGSVVINFLVEGVAQAYRRSRAKKILLTNLMTTAFENKGFSQEEIVEVFEKYIKMKKPFDLVVMADLGILPTRKLKKVMDFYRLEHSELLKICQKAKVKTIVEDVAMIEEKNMRLRHSEEKLTRLFKKIF